MLHTFWFYSITNFFRFSCDWKLHVKLKKYRDFLEKRLCQCSDVTQFFDELKLLVHTFAVHNKPEAWNIQYYDVIINNLQVCVIIIIYSYNLIIK